MFHVPQRILHKSKNNEIATEAIQISLQKISLEFLKSKVYGINYAFLSKLGYKQSAARAPKCQGKLIYLNGRILDFLKHKSCSRHSEVSITLKLASIKSLQL